MIAGGPIDSFAGLSRSSSLILALFLLASVASADYLTGYELSFSFFYLAPIALVAWNVGKRAGILVSAVAAITWWWADLLEQHPYSHPFFRYWNAAEVLAFFSTVAYLLSSLKGTLERETALARTDPLTELANRRGFFDLARTEINRSSRYQHPFTVAYIDVDFFKTVNDGFGHDTGDALLRSVSSTIRSSLRATDTVGRIGGDEFAILLPETGVESASWICQKLQQCLSDVMRQNQWPVTFSIGAVTFASPPDSIEAMIAMADRAMYSAKRNGKGGVKHEVFGVPARVA